MQGVSPAGAGAALTAGCQERAAGARPALAAPPRRSWGPAASPCLPPRSLPLRFSSGIKGRGRQERERGGEEGSASCRPASLWGVAALRFPCSAREVLFQAVSVSAASTGSTQGGLRQALLPLRRACLRHWILRRGEEEKGLLCKVFALLPKVSGGEQGGNTGGMFEEGCW